MMWTRFGGNLSIPFMSRTPQSLWPEYLGSKKLAAAGLTSGVLTIPPRDLLWIPFLITGYAGADIARFKFNADATAANYGTVFQTRTNVATPVLGRVANAGSLVGIVVAAAGITLGRVGELIISNNAATRKVIDIRIANESSTSTGPNKEEGWGEWLNTAAQITSIEMLTPTSNMNAGTGFAVFGMNL